MSGQILIVDDHEIVRRSLRSLLSSRPDWTVCGEAADGIQAIERAKSLRPDVVLMDISMPGMNGLEATRILRKDLPESKIIIISQNDPEVTRRQANEVGAAAYVAKSDLYLHLLPTVSKFLGHLKAGTPVDTPRIAPASSSQDWLAGGGELSKLIREHDWSQTPLGPLGSWPQSLKTSVNLILNSQHPMWVGWGPAATFLYNEAYIQVLSSAKHPGALGKPAADVWPEIWDVCGPLADKVFQKGEASFVDEVRLFMSRGNYLEETYYSFSYSPIRDESGIVAGLFCPSTEVTPKVINARRLRTLSKLSAHALVQKTAEAACQSAAAMLAENPDDVPFALLYLLDEEGKRARLEQVCGLPPGVRSLSPQVVDLTGEEDAHCLWPLSEVLESLQVRVVSVKNIEDLPHGLAQQPLSEAIILPVTTRGEDRTSGVLVAGVSPARKLDAEYRTFYELVAGQIATAIQNARSSEEERKRIEALAEIDRAKTAFFSNVSHEFRTPLTLILGPIEELLARSHTDLPPAAKSQLELVNRNGSRLLRLVNTLLDFSRIEAGRMQAVYQPTDLAAFTVELASVFRSATERAGLRLELNCPKLAEPVFVDRGMWEKIVLNLISNAFKFTFEGAIAVELKQAGREIELRIRDTGVGIPAHEIPRLFDRFHRIENTRSRTHEGSGIGLALVHELVKLHGGSVRVESKLREGSIFIVSVPLGSAHLSPDRIGGTRSLASTAVGAAPFVEEALRWLPAADYSENEIEIIPGDELLPVPCPPLSRDAASEKRPFVLVADDNSDMRRYLVRLLSERYDVHSVQDGQAALTFVHERNPELVLTDVMMPNLDGFGLLHELRSHPKTRTIPIILLSARAGEESRVEGMEHGADDYLIKPFSARELLARVQTHIEMARMRKQAEEALRRRTEQFETLLNAAPLGVYLVDSDFRIRAMNPTGVEIFGNIRNLVGRDFDEVIHILWPKGYADEIVERFRHTLTTGDPYVVPERVEKRLDRGVQEIYEWQINRIPLPDAGHGVVCYLRDISRQVLARQAIAESEKQLRLATEAAELGIWHWYPDEDRATWENDRLYEILGRTPEDGPLGAKEFTAKIVHPDDAKAFNEALSHALETGTRFFFQGRVYRKDGQLRWVEFTGQIESRADGSPLRMLGTVLDITQRKQTEETLRQHRDRFDLVAEASHVGFWFCDLPFDKLMWDKRVKEHFWLPPDADVSINTFYERLHPDDRERAHRAMADSIANHIPYDVEYRTVAPDGRHKWIRAMGRISYDSAGAPKSFDALTLDITERKQSEEAIRESEERLRLAQKTAHSGTWEKSFATGKLIVSPELEELWGLAPATIVGDNDAALRSVINSEDLAAVDRLLSQALETKEPEYRAEFRITRPDGVLRWIETIARIFYDSGGKALRIIGISFDVTERKQIRERERLMAAEAVAATAKFRAVFEQTPVFAGIVNIDGTVMDANQLCLEACGYKAEEVLGRLFWRTPWWRFSKEVQTKVQFAVRQSSQGVPYRETLTYHWADGTERLMDFAVHPIVDEEGKILFLHPTGVDITDLKRAEEKYRTLAETLDAEVRIRTRELEQRNVDVVRQSEQLRGLSSRLLQTQDEERRHIARELHDSAGQILAALGMGLAQVAQFTPKDNTQLAKIAEDCQQWVQQLSREIRTTSYLLHPPMLDEVGLPEALRWYIQGLTERSGLNISFTVAEEFGRLSREMELVMFRLVQECLTNIHRHSGSKTAMIRLNRQNESVALEVQDDGKGITPEKLSQIQAQGSGVGIRGMRERVRQFDGQMNIESSDKGTSISFSFPLSRTSASERDSTTEQVHAGK
jgi:PAS domain S-box-containing protein